MKSSRLMVVLLGGCAAGCPLGVGPADGGADAGHDAGLDGGLATCADLAAAECDRRQACGAALVTAEFGSLAACEAQLASDCTDARAAAGAAIDEKAIEACLLRVNAASCDQLLEPSRPTCDWPPGQQADGVPCYFDHQCRGRLCRRDSTHGGCGQCATQPAIGQSCSPDPDDGQTCADGQVCVNDVCQAGSFIAFEGEACDSVSGKTCTVSLSCVGGHCARGLAEGAPCSELFGQCDHLDSLVCLDGQCAPLPTRATGEACPPIGLPGGATCAAGNWCSLGLVCAALVSEGGACDGVAALCARSLECVGSWCTRPSQLDCAGGPVDSGTLTPEAPLYVDLPPGAMSYQLDCTHGSATFDFTARYLNRAAATVDLPVSAVIALEDGGQPQSLPILPAFTSPLPPDQATAVSYRASFNPGDWCQRCGSLARVQLTVELPDAGTATAAQQTPANCQL